MSERMYPIRRYEDLAYEAEDLIDNDERWVESDESPMETMMRAQVLATLAIERQLSIANTIAFRTATNSWHEDNERDMNDILTADRGRRIDYS